MTIKIEVTSLEVFIKSGVAAKTGKPYSIREQEAYAYTTDRSGQPSKYPQKIKINLGDSQAPYVLGMYVVAPESFFVDRFDNLSLGLYLRQQSVPASVAKAA